MTHDMYQSNAIKSDKTNGNMRELEYYWGAVGGSVEGSVGAVPNVTMVAHVVAQSNLFQQLHPNIMNWPSKTAPFLSVSLLGGHRVCWVLSAGLSSAGLSSAGEWEMEISKVRAV